LPSKAMSATSIVVSCASGRLPSCCRNIVAAVDLGGGVAYLCHVVSQPPHVLARLNSSTLLELYTACQALRLVPGTRLHL
ncbi:hypothetical protein BAE44_0025730, partial [Dichanthelium oligosanthes]